jgi:hypothetical protein
MKAFPFMLFLISMPFVLFSQSEDSYTDTVVHVSDLGSVIGLDCHKASEIEYVSLVRQNQIVNVYKDGNNYYGIASCWFYEEVPEGEEETGRVLVGMKHLSMQNAKEIFRVVQEERPDTLRDVTDIAGWGDCLDGETIHLRTYMHGKRTLKRWDCPDEEMVFPEAKIVLDFVDALNQLLKLDELYSETFDRITFEMHNSGGNISCARYLSKRERKKAKREREKFRKEYASETKI